MSNAPMVWCIPKGSLKLKQPIPFLIQSRSHKPGQLMKCCVLVLLLWVLMIIHIRNAKSTALAFLWESYLLITTSNKFIEQLQGQIWHTIIMGVLQIQFPPPFFLGEAITELDGGTSNRRLTTEGKARMRTSRNNLSVILFLLFRASVNEAWSN